MRDGSKDLNVTFPGPGSYKLGNIIGKDGPGILMHSKLGSQSKLETPGPGAYESPLKTKKQSPAYGLGT